MTISHIMTISHVTAMAGYQTSAVNQCPPKLPVLVIGQASLPSLIGEPDDAMRRVSNRRPMRTA